MDRQTDRPNWKGVIIFKLMDSFWVTNSNQSVDDQSEAHRLILRRLVNCRTTITVITTTGTIMTTTTTITVTTTNATTTIMTTTMTEEESSRSMAGSTDRQHL